MHYDSIEQAFCFFHQKWRVYSGLTSESQRDDIEYAVSKYADEMDRTVYRQISDGEVGFLHEHSRFKEDLVHSLEILEGLMTLRHENK